MSNWSINITRISRSGIKTNKIFEWYTHIAYYDIIIKMYIIFMEIDGDKDYNVKLINKNLKYVIFPLICGIQYLKRSSPQKQCS